MKRNKKRVIAAVLAVCALAAGGAAFTASNTFTSDNVAGYGNVQVSGADVQDINNTLSADGKQITGVARPSRAPSIRPRPSRSAGPPAVTRPA